MRYPVLFFDADHTLFDFDRGQEWAVERTFLDLSSSFSAEWFQRYTQINHGFWKSLERGEITLEYLKENRFRVFLEDVGVDIDHRQFNRTYLKRLGECTFLIDDAHSVVSKLAANNHTLVMVTNGLAEVQKPRFAAADITLHFEGTVISGEVGIAKPEAGIFDIAMQKVGSPAKTDVLMIGDNLNSDIQGGVNYGIDTCWFNPVQTQNTSELTPTHEINSLNELLELVG